MADPDQPETQPTPVKYVRRDDLLAEAGMEPRADYVLALAAASMLLGAILMTCAPLSMAAMINFGQSALGAGRVSGLELGYFAVVFVLGLWGVGAGLGVGYRIEIARKALIGWSIAWILYFVGAAILRVTIGGIEAREMRLSMLACFLGFSVGCGHHRPRGSDRESASPNQAARQGDFPHPRRSTKQEVNPTSRGRLSRRTHTSSRQNRELPPRLARQLRDHVVMLKIRHLDAHHLPSVQRLV